MRKLYIVFPILFLLIVSGTIYFYLPKHDLYPNRVPFIVPESEEEFENQDREEDDDEKKDGYDGPEARAQQEFDWMVDPSLGYVPYTRLNSALVYTHYLRDSLQNSLARMQSIMLWQERGPIYDSVGPSNGNTRANDPYTSGRMAAVLVDTLNDPTGNTAIVGGVSGGVWKCTNFLSAVPSWQNVFDYFDNMAISSICQDPTNPNVMYFSTGEASSNADAHFGLGVWKSTDKGNTWQQLPSSANFIRNWKIICDASGNIYLASRTTATPALNTSGLLRSIDGGATWTNITPTAQGTATASATCTDIEYTTTGKLVASFGYSTSGTTIRIYTTNNPATVTQSTGWTLATGIRNSATTAGRIELASQGNIVYGVAVNSAANADSCYKSVDGGATWVKQNTTVMPTGVLSGQGWYNATLSINPANPNELMCGGLDAYRSTNGGATWTRTTFWVTTAPYVHADHHYMHWWKRGNESQIVIGCDGGVYYSVDGGSTWVDKNRNLGLKQFYGADIHPYAGSPYLLAGSQDNGTHQIKNPGLTYSHEVTGGDGMHVWINQQDPSIQFGSYVYNQYRRSTNGGATWSSLNLNTNTGMFANPYALDETQNILYACYSANNLLRWPSASTAGATAFNTVTISLLNNAQIGSLKVSPYTANRLFLGSSGGRVIRVDNASAATPTATIISSGFPTGFIRSVNVGSSDNNIVATFSNFGVAQVWVTTNGGTTWTNVDGNLPDMPVWWALFDPYDNNKMYLATETGVWTTDLLNGASTYWIPNPGLPTTRIAMLRMRTSDNAVVASTYGRGLFTARIPPPTPEISFVQPSSIAAEANSGITSGASGCRSYKDYVINTGIVNDPTGDATVTYSVQAGNTAIRGVDFDFTTNGNFSNPTTTHVFPDGQMILRPVTIRVYDDADVESPESFTLTYTVSGTTDAISGPVNAHVITINDNDRAPVPFTSADFTVGNYNVDMSTLNTPFDATKLKHRLQVIYRASEMKASGISINAVINSIKLRVKTKNTTQPFKAFTIQIANTYKVNMASGFITGIPFTQVYSGDYSTVAGVNSFNFSTPFVWDGVSNVVIQFCFDNTGGTAEGVTDIVEGMAAAFAAGVRASVYSNHTTATGAGCSLAAAFLDDNRINTTFNATFGDQVATALNSTKTENLGSRNDLHYYTSNGQIMARVLNLSDHNYGCTEVIVDRAGTGTKEFWNANRENYLMDKTFRILPTTNNATGRYEVTFYFTKAEKEGWEAATGKPWDSIQIIKLPSRISNVSPANAQPDGPGTIKVIDAVKRSFGPNYYTLSGIFETGFSGYGFGVAGRMTTLLVLNGQASGTNINLSWSTSAEVNSSIFEVEKSYDGANFRRIGTVQASGNKLNPSTYNFTDPENVQYNYYRIRMQHTDGYVLYSNTIFIKKDDAPQRLIISPNPFTNYITVMFARPSSGRVTFSFFDMKGALVKRYTSPGNSPTYYIATDDIALTGVYSLRIDYDGNKVVKPLLKK